MIVLACPKCYGVSVKKYEGEMTENGHDWFTCETKNCGENFSLKNASYRVERNIYE